MTIDDFLPLGQHPLDPGKRRDPIRELLSWLWCDLIWTVEHAMSVDAHRTDNQPDDEACEFGCLLGNTDGTLRRLARLIELLALGHVVNWRKPSPKENNPPYFERGSTIVPARLLDLGDHPLDPSGASDPLAVLLLDGKRALVRLTDYTDEYLIARHTAPVEADALAHRMSDTAQRARALLARAIELLLMGYWLAPPPDEAALADLRTFKKYSSEDWLAATRPTAMCPVLRPLDYGVTARFAPEKWQSFALACVRRVQHKFTDGRTHRLVEAVEEVADGGLSAEELTASWKELIATNQDANGASERGTPERQAARSAFQALEKCRGCLKEDAAERVTYYARAASDDPDAEALAQAALLREVFGNPFRVSAPETEWLDWSGGTVVILARGIHDERAFDRMPILGDALQDAGCTDAEILAHCRGPHEHVRGCWVLDLLLGRHLLTQTEQGTT